jgi:membrane protease YdiL (CAAX protease family)
MDIERIKLWIFYAIIVSIALFTLFWQQILEYNQILGNILIAIFSVIWVVSIFIFLRGVRRNIYQNLYKPDKTDKAERVKRTFMYVLVIAILVILVLIVATFMG